MKAKKVYQYCLVLCGLFLALSGIACLVVATLLNHDSDLKMSHESKSRTYATQYWLGLPIIAFGGLVMLISPSLHKRKKMAAFNLFTCIPLLTCALVAVVLHGTAYTHFLSIHQNRLFLKNHNYICSDFTSDSTQCRCTKQDNLAIKKEFSVPCAQQKSLVGFHGALLTFSALAFALLLGIFVISVIFLLHFFKLELAMTTTTSGQDNGGFSHARGRRHSIGVHIDAPVSQHPSLTTLNIPLERPPSYESLLTSFNMTPHDVTSRDMTSHIVTHDVTDGRNRAATVNRNARVRHIGQLSSRLNNQIPERAEQGEDSNELENLEEQMAVNEVDGTATQSSISNPVRSTQASDERNRTTQANTESGQVTSNDFDTRTSESLEVSHEQTTTNYINEPRSEQNREPTLETRSGRSVRNTHSFLEPSDELVSHEGSNSSGQSSSIRNPIPAAEQSNEMHVTRNSSGRSIRNIQQPSIEHSSEMVTHDINIPSRHQRQSIRDPHLFIEHSNQIATHERSNSTLPPHTHLEPTVSTNSEDGVYIDITQNQAPSSVPSDTTRITVRYRGQLDSSSVNSIQTRSLITHEQDDTTDQSVVNVNLSERTTEEDHDISNEISSPDSTEQTTGSFITNNDTAEEASTDVVMDTENLTGPDEIHNEIPPQRDCPSVSSENSDLYPHNFIMSI